MNALEGIEKAINHVEERGVVPEKIIVHPTYTTRGYVFVVEHDGKLYVIANRIDLDVAIATLIMQKTEKDLFDFCGGVPISDEPSDMIAVNGGFYVWTLELR